MSTTSSTRIPPTLVFGGVAFAHFEDMTNRFTDEDLVRILDILKENDIPVDTARIYGDSELTLGRLGAEKRGIRLQTKAAGFYAGCGKRETVLESVKTSLEALKTKQVEVLYLHSPDPDPSSDIHETIDALQELYLTGAFQKWGLSNFTASEVESAHSYALSKNYVLPTVFSGSLSAVARLVETELFPTLRRLNISFTAYSPITGGLLLMTPDQFQARLAEPGGRWNPAVVIGKLYNASFNKPEYLQALVEWDKISAESGISKLELAFRWVLFHSVLDGAKGDALIFGPSRMGQFEQTLKLLKEAKPLPEPLVAKIDEIWEIVKEVAPLDNYHGMTN
ncbi:putative aldehyde reductase [Kalaharituber pfeilii]|nr:putative aldehyde reductase [Kalaharituber pfeilii]